MHELSTLSAWGRSRLVLNRTESTNRIAHQLLAHVPAEGTCIRAIHQTAGRGQLGSVWESEAGANLTCSVVLYPTFVLPEKIFALNMLASLAILTTVQRLTGLVEGVAVKWPNDVLVSGQKVCGILIETQLTGQLVDSAVVGIGLNVNQRTFAEGWRAKTTSLSLITGRTFEVEQVESVVLSELEIWYNRLKQSGWHVLEDFYLKHLYGFDTTLSYRDATGIFKGLITGIMPDGRLRVSPQDINDHNERIYQPREISLEE
jgi:BirA family transcriptional regulator, biotin operon repressor / biotin---[acetyl-CoA-carboxylase] ligase